ncbi:proteasome subunit beta type-3-like [Clytia hemisphaerica]|uniref:Proteasome subunit beta n=1 Tax=Clytia hemisphaerica TaxID=252671 RepID=A0A7M6DME2_9CNID|eukprot:TCONS_00000476-protein
MSIMSYNGSALVAMKGKDCVAIASDLRYGIQLQTVAFDFEKIFQISDKLYLGLSGLATDIQTVSNLAKFRTNLYELRENRKVSPKAFMNIMSNILYGRRFGPYFVEPIICGLHPKTNEPYIASCDLIGCPMEPEDFVVGGTCSEQLYGMCEVVWEPDMGPDDLFESISQALLNAQDRDCMAGWGAVVHIIEKDKVTTRKLKGRMD